MSVFELSVPIARPDVVEWLQTVPANKLPQVVENTLAAGHLALSLLQASTGEQSMHQFFGPVLEPMQQLKNTIDGILKATQKSQRLGELGESIVVEQLKSAFPSDDFQLVSTEDHQADIHAHFVLPNSQIQSALVEVKLYSSDVPSKEIAKFRRDLEQTRFRFGLMVSLTSRLSGINGPLHLEETPEYTAVYLPNSGVDGYRLLCAVAMLKALVFYRVRHASLIPAGAVEQAWERLNAELKELEEVIAEVHDLKTSIQAAHQSLAGIFGKMTEKAISAECRLRYALDRITNRLAEELLHLPHASCLPLLPSAEPDAVLGFLEDLRNANDSRLHAFEGIYDLSCRLGLQVSLNDGHWHLHRNGIALAWTEGTKNRLDACVSVDVNRSPEVSIDVRLEKIKHGHVIISGAVPGEMLARMEMRLGSESGGKALVSSTM